MLKLEQNYLFLIFKLDEFVNRLVKVPKKKIDFSENIKSDRIYTKNDQFS